MNYYRLRNVCAECAVVSRDRAYQSFPLHIYTFCRCFFFFFFFFSPFAQSRFRVNRSDRRNREYNRTTRLFVIYQKPYDASRSRGETIIFTLSCFQTGMDQLRLKQHLYFRSEHQLRRLNFRSAPTPIALLIFYRFLIFTWI